MALFIDDGLKEKLKSLRAKAAPSETGGVLVGYYDFQANMVVVVDCVEAPPDSKSSPWSFERGIQGLAERIKEISRRTASIVGYVGEWHSHPPGHSAHPSKADLVQLWYLALGMADEGLPALSLIVGEDDISILQGKAG